MIKIIQAHYLGDFQISLTFSSGEEGIFEGHALLKRDGSLLDPLRMEAYFKRFFIDAGALSWPNGLELSPARIYAMCKITEGA